jgi:hypothetical protein
MNILRQRLFSNWHLMRIVRLIISVGLLIMALRSKDIALSSLILLSLITTLAGVGCCGSQGCSISDIRHGLGIISGEQKKSNIEEGFKQ